MTANSTTILDKLVANGIEKADDPAMTNRVGCFGSVAFTEDSRCRSCKDYDGCKDVDRSEQYLVVEEEVREIAAYYKLEDELRAMGALADGRKSELREAQAPKKPRKAAVKRAPARPAGPKTADDIDWNKLSFSSKVLKFDFDEAIVDLVAQKPDHYKVAVEIVDKHNGNDAGTRASMYGFVVKVLNELMRQKILTWNQKDKSAGIQWHLEVK